MNIDTAMEVIKSGLEDYCKGCNEDVHLEVNSAFETVIRSLKSDDILCETCGHSLKAHRPNGECHEGLGTKSCCCSDFKGGKAWKVEQEFASGWDDAPFSEDDKPMRLRTRKEAQAEIDEFIADQHAAVAEGDMDDEYDPESYRPALI